MAIDRGPEIEVSLSIEVTLSLLTVFKAYGLGCNQEYVTSKKCMYIKTKKKEKKKVE